MQTLFVILVSKALAQMEPTFNPEFYGSVLQNSKTIANGRRLEEQTLLQGQGLEVAQIEKSLQAQNQQLGEMEKVVEKIVDIAQHLTDRVDQVELKLMEVGPAQMKLHDDNQRINATLQATLQTQFVQKSEIAELEGHISQAKVLNQDAQQIATAQTAQIEAKLKSATEVSERARATAAATQEQVAKELEAAQGEMSRLEQDMQDVKAASLSAEKKIAQVSATAQKQAAYVEQETRTALKALLASGAAETPMNSMQLRGQSQGEQYFQRNPHRRQVSSEAAQFDSRLGAGR